MHHIFLKIILSLIIFTSLTYAQNNSSLEDLYNVKLQIQTVKLDMQNTNKNQENQIIKMQNDITELKNLIHTQNINETVLINKVNNYNLKISNQDRIINNLNFYVSMYGIIITILLLGVSFATYNLSSNKAESLIKKWLDTKASKVLKPIYDGYMKSLEKETSILRKKDKNKINNLNKQSYTSKEISELKKIDKVRTAKEWHDLFNEAYINENYEDAIKYIEKASTLNPKDDSIFNNWGNALLALAKQENDKELFKESLEKLKLAIDLGGRTYNLACLYAAQNNSKEALKYLEISLQKQEIESSFVLNDDDFKDIKNTDKFKKLLKKYK